MRILLHSGPGFISRAIRFQTRSAWNHASLLFDDRYVIEAREFKGVVRTPVSDIIKAMTKEPRLRVAVYDFAEPLTETEIERARQHAENQLGLPYDYGAVFRFISRRASVINGRWFCSELVTEVANMATRPLFRETAAWEVSPGLIPRTPVLVYRCELPSLLP